MKKMKSLDNQTDKEIKFIEGDFWECSYEIDGEEFFCTEYQESEDYCPDDYWVEGETSFVLLTVSFEEESLGLKFTAIVTFDKNENDEWEEMIDKDGISAVAEASISYI